MRMMVACSRTSEYCSFLETSQIGEGRDGGAAVQNENIELVSLWGKLFVILMMDTQSSVFHSRAFKRSKQ